MCGLAREADVTPGAEDVTPGARRCEHISPPFDAALLAACGAAGSQREMANLPSQYAPSRASQTSTRTPPQRRLDSPWPSTGRARGTRRSLSCATQRAQSVAASARGACSSARCDVAHARAPRWFRLARGRKLSAHGVHINEWLHFASVTGVLQFADRVRQGMPQHQLKAQSQQHTRLLEQCTPEYFSKGAAPQHRLWCDSCRAQMPAVYEACQYSALATCRKDAECMAWSGRMDPR